jgi:GAF domain-containing protein
MQTSFFAQVGNVEWVCVIVASLLGLTGIYIGQKTRAQSLLVLRQLEREKRRADKLANIVIPIGLELAVETDLNKLLEKILIEARALARADGGTLYLLTPEKTLRFVMVLNDSLKIAMGGTSGREVSLPPLPLYDPATGRPNLGNIAASCALGAKTISISDAYGSHGFDFSGARAFDQKMNYRTISVLCVPLKDTGHEVIGVLQLINALDPETGRTIPFDDHLAQMMELLGRLAAAALQSYLKFKVLKDQITDLKIQIDEAKKERQVAEITGSDYFKDLQSKARQMRSKVKGREP